MRFRDGIRIRKSKVWKRHYNILSERCLDTVDANGGTMRCCTLESEEQCQTVVPRWYR